MSISSLTSLAVEREINSRTRICRADDARLFIAKTERIADRVVIESRLQLIEHLRSNGFPCPALIDVDGRKYVQQGDCVTYYQEYLPFQESEQRDSFDRRFLSDAIMLMRSFHTLSQSLQDSVLASRFRPQFETYVAQRLVEAESLGNAESTRVLRWLQSECNAIASLPLLPCHGSFRHHNLRYDRAGRLYVIDFFHGFTYAPRVLDLCIFLVQFSLGSQWMPPLQPDHWWPWIRGAVKWGFYTPAMLQSVISQYGIAQGERQVIIPSVYLSLVRNSGFHGSAAAPCFTRFIRLLSTVLESDNHPL